jgi:hypothetical protein
MEVVLMLAIGFALASIFSVFNKNKTLVIGSVALCGCCLATAWALY